MTARAPEPPLTKAELARLLRAFAALIERSEAEGAPEPPRRAPRRGRRAGADALPVDEVTRERIRQTLRRIGERP